MDDNISNNIIDKTTRKMMFICNAIEDGWCVHKDNNKYYFIKKHENKKEVLSEQYLENFIVKNFSNNITIN